MKENQEATASRSAPRELLKEVLQTEEQRYKKETWNNRNELRATEMISTYKYNRLFFS